MKPTPFPSPNDGLDAAVRKTEALQLTSLALEIEDYLKRMAEARGSDAVAPSASRSKTRVSAIRQPAASKSAEGTAGDETAAKLRRGIQVSWDPALREHELYAYYYDRVDQPAVAHEGE